MAAFIKHTYMRLILRSILLLILPSLLFGCLSSRVFQPKRLNVLGDYYHKNTMVKFPENFDGLKRESITSFDKDSSNIGVSYHRSNSNQNLMVTVYIYPATSGIEHRIRDEYFESLQSIATVSNQGINTTPKHIRVSKDGYSVLGLSGVISNKNQSTVLVLFECGKYFLKYRISSTDMDPGVLEDISNKLTDKFSPIDIVKKQPLIQGVDVHISPGITTDTISLIAIFAAVKSKIDWAYQNVDSLERCSGFPSLYFEEQKTSIDSMLNKWESLKHHNTKFDKFFDELVGIRKNGFLNEFICDQYWGTLLLPKELKLDWSGYNLWKRKNNPTVKLVGEYYYLLGFEQSFKKDKKN